MRCLSGLAMRAEQFAAQMPLFEIAARSARSQDVGEAAKPLLGGQRATTRQKVAEALRAIRECSRLKVLAEGGLREREAGSKASQL